MTGSAARVLGACFILVIGIAWLGSGVAWAGLVREATSPAGIEVWLAEDRAAPVVSIRFAFAGGSAAEPAGKNGLARVLASLINEGADGIEPSAYRQRVQRGGLRIQFQSGRDGLYGSADMPAGSIGEAVELIGATISHPAFNDEALDKVRTRIIADLDGSASDPRVVAGDAWYEEAFQAQAYGRAPDGRKSEVAGIDLADVRALHAKMLGLSRLSVVVAGAITSDEALSFVDRLFGSLPNGRREAATPAATPAGRPTTRISHAGRGAAIVFGVPAPSPGHPDHAAARVVAHILASGDLECRLVAELRQKLGLAYAADASIASDRYGTLMLGTVVTGSDKADAAVDALRTTIAAFAGDGPTREEVDTAMTAIVGGYLLSLDSTSSLANAMLYARLDGDRPDFIDRRRRALQSVTVDDVRRVAREMLAANRLIIVIAAGASD